MYRETEIQRERQRESLQRESGERVEREFKLGRGERELRESLSLAGDLTFREKRTGKAKNKNSRGIEPATREAEYQVQCSTIIPARTLTQN